MVLAPRPAPIRDSARVYARASLMKDDRRPSRARAILEWVAGPRPRKFGNRPRTPVSRRTGRATPMPIVAMGPWTAMAASPASTITSTTPSAHRSARAARCR